MQKFAVVILTLASLTAGNAFAKKVSPPARGTPKPTRTDCEKALANMYKIAGITPNDDAKKDNEAKCEKEYTKPFTDCVVAAKTADQLAGCKDKNK